ncbi:MAG: hypothetical protein J0M10_09720 [Chitinophagales bacterium]|nr:hypothetical protein [Chitinophagales bacterium]
MKTNATSTAFLAVSLLLSTPLLSQQTRAFNQNSSRSNHTRGMSIYFSPVYTTPVEKAPDSLLFRGSGAGVKFGADYFFGNIGLGAVSGFSSSVADDALINDFLKRNSIPQDQLVINKSSQQSMYLLLGPSLRWGKSVQLFAHAKGGLFINNGGLVNIQQKGATRSIYRNEATTKSIYPGFQTGLGIQYSTKSDTWSFGFGADYMNTKAQVQNFDLRRGSGIEGLKLSRNISDLMAGISIRYTIKSPRDAASGQATGKRSRETGSGLPTGRRSTLSTRDAASGLPTGRRSAGVVTEEVTITDVVEMPDPGENCGPVIHRTTNPDGSTSVMTFACPDDAAAFQRSLSSGMPNRISMNVTTPKQTQGATFGEKVNQGLQSGASGARQTQGATFGEKVNQGLHAAGSAVSQGANIISGNIGWATESTTGIVTNRTVSKLAGGGSGAAAASYAATGLMVNNPGSGSVLTLYTREPGSGQASGRRDKGSGLATGRRQYQPFYREGSGNGCDTCVSAVRLSNVQNNPYFAGNELAGENVEMVSGHNNPLYNESQNAGNNPLYGRSTQGSTGQSGDGLKGLDVYLKDPHSGAVIASTVTDAAGNFFFANVPDGNYVVAMSGVYLTRKGYQYYMAKSADIMGTVETGGTSLLVRIDMQATETGLDAATAAALIKTKTKSNQSNDRKAAPAAETEIWSPRSNLKTIPLAAADIDDDGVAELVGGALPGGGIVSAMARPGNPIGGISVKGGKNPGGNIGSRTTNEQGEFEFTALDAGSYTITVEQKLYINDALFISTGNSRAQDHNSTRSNKTASGIAPDPGNGGGGNGGNKVQDHNSSRSNKSSSIAAPDTDNDGSDGKARDYNSSRSNKTASVFDNNPENGDDSNRKGIVKLTASQNSQSLRTISVVADMDGDGVYETDVTTKVSDELIMEKDGSFSSPQQKAGISTSRSNIRNKRSVQAVTPTVFTVQGSATVNGRDVPVQAVYKVVEKATSGLKDTLKTQV